MKRKIIFSFFLALVFSPLSRPAQADSMKFIFLYPGGQGSQAQAQNILDEFSDALKKASGGKIDAKIYYFNTLAGGEKFIQQEKPAGGILAEDLFATKGNNWDAQELLRTQPLPSGDGTNQYFILGRTDQRLPPSGAILVYSSNRLAESFLKEKLFPQLGKRLLIKHTPNVVGLLRKIGRGQNKDWILLNQFEKATVTRSNASWAQALKVEASSQKVPSAPWVVFPGNITPEHSKLLKEALLKLSKDKANQQTLEMLRLKGFQE